MAMQHHWQDFILHPANTEGVRSREERLDVDRAVEAARDGWDPALHPVRVRLEDVLAPAPGDAFEAMEFGEHGDVLIWTSTRVWYVRRENGIKERLRWLPRHPQDGAAG